MYKKVVKFKSKSIEYLSEKNILSKMEKKIVLLKTGQKQMLIFVNYEHKI